jgi:hypothetical protein
MATMWNVCGTSGSTDKHFVGVLSVGMAPEKEQSQPCGMCNNLWYIVYRGTWTQAQLQYLLSAIGIVTRAIRTIAPYKSQTATYQMCAFQIQVTDSRHDNRT